VEHWPVSDAIPALLNVAVGLGVSMALTPPQTAIVLSPKTSSRLFIFLNAFKTPVRKIEER
jgi:hypothetical protein